jgi:hypothetical protein
MQLELGISFAAPVPRHPANTLRFPRLASGKALRLVLGARLRDVPTDGTRRQAHGSADFSGCPFSGAAHGFSCGHSHKFQKTGLVRIDYDEFCDALGAPGSIRAGKTSASFGAA